MKNDNIHIFFRCFWLQILNLPTLLQNNDLDRFHGNGPYGKTPTEKEPIKAHGFAWRVFPYNKRRWFRDLA